MIPTTRDRLPRVSEIAALVERSGSQPGRRHPLALGSWTLGRSGHAEVGLDHADVSRRHARIHVTRSGAEIEDLGSKNGTRIAGRRVGRAELRHGDQLQFGDLIVEFEHHVAHLDRVLSERHELTVTRVRASPASPSEPAPAPPLPLLAPLLVSGALVILLVVMLVHG